MAIFDFESVPVQEDKFHDTNNTTWIGKRVSISVSFSSNLIEEPNFSFNSNWTDLVESFVYALGGLATRSLFQKPKRVLWRLTLR